MKALFACEESQECTIAFRGKGVEAYSCDTLPCSGGHPEWHIQGDVLLLLKEDWDLVVAFPPCTDLAVSGARYFAQKQENGSQQASIDFFLKFTKLKCKWAIENPVGIMSTKYRKPDQIIQPWMFGHKESKKTCLWLNGLRPISPTNVVHPDFYRCKCGNVFEYDYGKYGCCGSASLPLWSNQTKSGQNKLPPSKDRAKLRSKTYQGIAKAMANQWCNI